MTDSVNFKSLLNEKCQTINNETFSKIKVMPIYKTDPIVDQNGQVAWQTKVFIGARCFQHGPMQDRKIDAELEAAKLCLDRLQWLEREIYLKKKSISESMQTGQTMTLTVQELLLLSSMIPANIQNQIEILFQAIHAQPLTGHIKFRITTEKQDNSSISATSTWLAKIAAFNNDECTATNLLSPGWAESSKFCNSEKDAIEQAALTLLSVTAREIEYRIQNNR